MNLIAAQRVKSSPHWTLFEHFLGVDRCVFIIAADQNVLEEALTRAAKQETPANDDNPYYSTGSAYLDKVFQYQVSLPPLLLQSVTNYASTLVDGRGGLWSEINTEYVLSVLIPTHVTSPRRVKHLLNAFALTYRMAQARHQSGLLAENPNECAPGIARLACLRVEFPLFARHLEVDANLPSLVLQLVRDREAELPAGVSDRARDIARAYALENASPGTLLTHGEDDEDDEGSSEATPTTEAHNRQLLNYLSRTRQVRGPSRDLVYMQSTGTVFGLDGDVALAIEKAAEDGDSASLERRFTDLDEADRGSALELLSEQIRTAGGIVGPNAARAFLLLNEALPDLPIEKVVDAVTEAICVMQDDARNVLDEDTVGSAWTLAKAGSEASAAALRRHVVAATIAPESKASHDFLLVDAVMALDAAPEEMTAYLASRLVSDDGSSTLAQIFALTDEDLVSVLTTLRGPVARLAGTAVAARQSWEKAQKDAATAASAARVQTAAQAAAPEAEEEEPYDPDELFAALATEAASRETPVQHATLRLLLAIDALGARTAALRLIGATEPTDAPDLALPILQATHRRVLAEWPGWLAGVDESAIGPVHAQPLRRLVAKVWTENASESDADASLEALEPLIAALPANQRPDLTSDVLEKIQVAVMDATEASARTGLLLKAQRFISSGFVDADRVAEAVIATLAETLALDLTPVEQDDPLYTYVAKDGSNALRARSAALTDEQVAAVVSAAASSPWLDDLGRAEVRMELATAVGKSAGDIDALPTAQEIAETVAEYGDAATHAAALWVSLVRPGAEALDPIVKSLRAENALSDEFAAASVAAQRTWSPTEHREFLDRYLADADEQVPTELVLKTIGWTSADEGVVADLLRSRFVAATNNAQRQGVVTLWGKAGIQEPGPRRQLIESVIYGLLDLHKETGGNASAVDLALTALDNLGNPLPHGVKGALGRRLRDAVTGNDALEEKALRVLPRLGYSTSSKGFLGRSKRVDFTDD